MNPEPKKTSGSSSQSWGSAVIGFEFVAAIAGFAIIGYFIDRWQGTEPTWTITLTVLGFVGGTYNLIKEVRKIQSRTHRRTPRKRNEGEIDAKAASADIAAKRGRPRPTGRVDLFARDAISEEDIENVEIDWPAEERDEIEDQLRSAQDNDPEDPAR